MNQVDKGLLISKGFLNEVEQIRESKLETTALLESIVFAGAVLENGTDLKRLKAISSYIEELAVRKHFLHIHLYVQRCFADCRRRGELDGFYVASLHEEALKIYAMYFAMSLKKLSNSLDKTCLSIEVNDALLHLRGILDSDRQVPVGNKKVEEKDHD